MEFKGSFLSRLFKTKANAEEAAAEEENIQTSVQPQAETKAPEPLRHRLELPQNHALIKLWDIYSEQAGPQPRPDLTLEGPSDPILPDAEGNRELRRLQMVVSASASKRLEKLRSQKKEEEQASPPDLDAQVTVFLAQNELTAWLLAYPPAGKGREVDREILDQALEKQKVRFGLDEDLLNALPQNPRRYFKLFPVARGVEAVPGADGQVVENYPRTEEKKPVVDEHNRADYTNLGFIHNVEKGGVICQIILPTDGTPGRTVRDQEVPTKNGKAAVVPKGRNTELSEDGEALVATISGHVEFSGRSFQVKPVMDIPGNVDFSVGNINFLGDVCVHGDVCSGFIVRATGSITIEGVVEASTVEAGRDLVVAKGVQGDNQAVIRAQGSVFAKYLENSCVYAKQDLETECIINCDVYCGGGVDVRTGHSKIIGGKVHAAREIHSGVVGSRVGNRTDIVLGGQPCEEFDYELLSKEIDRKSVV